MGAGSGSILASLVVHLQPLGVCSTVKRQDGRLSRPFLQVPPPQRMTQGGSILQPVGYGSSASVGVHGFADGSSPAFGMMMLALRVLGGVCGSSVDGTPKVVVEVAGSSGT